MNLEAVRLLVIRQVVLILVAHLLPEFPVPDGIIQKDFVGPPGSRIVINTVVKEEDRPLPVHQPLQGRCTQPLFVRQSGHIQDFYRFGGRIEHTNIICTL